MVRKSAPHPDLYRRIVKAKLFIDVHFQSQIDLSRIAGEASFSEFHFLRLFKRAYNCTPHQYLTRKRIELAKQLLSNSEYSISEICEQIGFESPGSFSSLFRREAGVTPLVFRNQALTKKELMKKRPTGFIPHCQLEKFGFHIEGLRTYLK